MNGSGRSKHVTIVAFYSRTTGCYLHLKEAGIEMFHVAMLAITSITT
jgi:hypothetical protein